MVALEQSRSLAEIQHAFAIGLLGVDGVLPSSVAMFNPGRSHSGFAVYRNNVLIGLTKALAARFPTVLHILGEEVFFGIAARFVVAVPPKSPLLMAYGDAFPGFLREIGLAASAHYLADIAAIDAARTRAYHAADASPVSRALFETLVPEDPATIKITLHPSVVMLRLKTPAVTGWQANQPGSDNRLGHWRAEDALIARPRLAVGLWRLPDGGFEFLMALRRGAQLADAAAAGADASAAFDLTDNLALLISSEVAVRIS